MYFAGIDLGTTYVKTHSGICFPSGISRNHDFANNTMEIDGKRYAMEVFNHKAEVDFNINKSHNQNVRLNFLYALTKMTQGADGYVENVIVGLPCSQWKNEDTVENFKNVLRADTEVKLIVNNIHKSIYVQNIDVIPEGSAAYYAVDYTKFNGRKVLIIDIGGLTLNSILFDNDDMVDLHTDEFGVLKVYKDIAEALTIKTGYNVIFEDIFDILINGFAPKGKSIDITGIIAPLLDKYSYMIYKNLNLKWSVDTIPYILLVGAGSITIAPYICNYIPHAELQDDAQMLTARGMGEMAGVFI